MPYWAILVIFKVFDTGRRNREKVTCSQITVGGVQILIYIYIVRDQRSSLVYNRIYSSFNGGAFTNKYLIKIESSGVEHYILTKSRICLLKFTVEIFFEIYKFASKIGPSFDSKF